MDVFDARLRTLESVCNVSNDKWSQKSIITTIIGEIKTQLADIHEVKADIHKAKTDINKVKADIHEVKAEIHEVKGYIYQVEADISKINTNIYEVKADIYGVKVNIYEVKADIHEVKTQLADIQKVKADIHEVKSDIPEVKAQLAALQQDKGRANDGVSVNVPSVSADMANIDTMTSLSANIDTMKLKLDNVETILLTKLAEIDTRISQLERTRQEFNEVRKENIIEPETEHVNQRLEDEIDSGTTSETNIEVLKLQLKKLNHDINLKNNKKSKKKHEVLNQFIQAITKDVHLISPRQEQMRLFVDYIAASSGKKKSQWLKLQLQMIEKNRKTDGAVKELKSFVEIVNENSISSDKYSRLENTVSILAENSATRDYVDESVKQQLINETGEINELSTKLQILETKNIEMQCFVDEMAKLSDPDLRKDYDLQLIVVKAIQDEIKVQKKTLEEKISQLDNKLNEKILQMVSDIISK